jgi:peptidoglycan/xylan/chitin deacetylase (PgdA/CDA1 family)
MHPLSPLTSTNLVIYFHSVPSSNWFRSTLGTIKSIYKLISIEDIESFCYNKKKFNNCCHICFDDGDRTVYEHAFPVLKEMNVPATLFVSPKIISDGSNYWFQELSYIRKQLNDILIKETICEIFDCDYSEIKKFMILSIFKSMKLDDILKVMNVIKKKYNIKIEKSFNITKDQLYELYNSEIFTIGAHTMNHPILCNETNDRVEKEISESIEKLSEMLNTDITYFAYPNGAINLDFSNREILILKKNKIKLAFTTENHFFNDNTNPFSIPRLQFSDIKIGSNSVYILGKLFTVPMWQSILTIIFLGKNEIKERMEIKDLSIFK